MQYLHEDILSLLIHYRQDNELKFNIHKPVDSLVLKWTIGINISELSTSPCALANKGDFCLIGQFFLRLSLINFTSGSGRLEKADKDFKKQQGRLA